MVLRNEGAPVAIGSYHPAFGVTLSLPTPAGRTGALAVLQPELSPDEGDRAGKTVEILRVARLIDHEMGEAESQPGPFMKA